MKKNKLLKVLSATAIVSTLALANVSTEIAGQNNFTLAAEQSSKVIELTPTPNSLNGAISLQHAYEKNKPSMGHAALVGGTVQKVGNTYKYTVKFKSIYFLGVSDGISKFWVEGKEYPLVKTGGADNEVEITFNSDTLKEKFNVEVFVNAMEEINAGSGRQSAILNYNLSDADKAVLEGKESATTTPSQPNESTTPNTEPSQPTTPSTQPTRPTLTAPKTVHVPVNNDLNKKEVILDTTKASLKNDGDHTKNSAFNAALDKVTIEKVGNQYKYTLQVKKAKARGIDFELTKIYYSDFNTPLTSLTLDEATSTKIVSFTTDKLYSTLPLRASTVYPGGGEMTHNVALVLNIPAGDIATISAPPTGPTNPTNPGGKTSQTPRKDSQSSSTKGTTQTVTFYNGLTAKLMHASEAGRYSMGNAALSRITAFKDANGTYHYKVRFHDISIGTLSDGISRFWVNGKEYSVVKTGGPKNEIEVHFTSSQKLSNVPVSVFVQTMENIMPGAGKKDAILVLDWSKVVESQETINVEEPAAPAGGGQDGEGGTTNPGTLTPTGGRFNNAAGGRLSNTGLETSSSLFAGFVTLAGAYLVGRRKQR